MQQQQLGQTGINVSAIGLGAMPLSLSSRPPEAQAIAVIHKALDLGVTLIDTADAYCQDDADKHHNEHLIAKALQTYPGDTSPVIVATKGGLMRPNGSWTQNGNPKHLERTIQESFTALGEQKPIDLWQYHSPDPNYRIQDSLAPVRKAVDAGLIRFVGVSNFSVDQIRQAQEVVTVTSVQNQFNPWQRQPEFDGVLEYCQQQGITFLPWSPLGGSRRVANLASFPVLTQLAQAKSASVYQIVLAWLRAKSPQLLPIPGASKVASIIDSVNSLQVTLTPADIAAVDGVSAAT